MKATLTLAVIAAFVAAACGAPATKALADSDWVAAKIWSKKYADIVHNLVETINSTALNDTANQAASLKISKELEKSNKAAFQSFITIVHGIDHETLTVPEAIDQLDEIGDILDAFMRSVSAELKQLSPSAQETIEKAAVAAKEDSVVVATKLVQALQGLHTIINWEKAQSFVEELKKILSTAVTSIAKIAVEADPKVGGQIADIVNTVGVDNGAILAEIEGEIKTESLTGEKLFNHESNMDDIFIAAQEKVSELLLDLPENTVDSIKVISDQAAKDFNDKMWELGNLIVFGENKNL